MNRITTFFTTFDLGEAGDVEGFVEIMHDDVMEAWAFIGNGTREAVSITKLLPRSSKDRILREWDHEKGILKLRGPKKASAWEPNDAA